MSRSCFKPRKAVRKISLIRSSGDFATAPELVCWCWSESLFLCDGLGWLIYTRLCLVRWFPFFQQAFLPCFYHSQLNVSKDYIAVWMHVSVSYFTPFSIHLTFRFTPFSTSVSICHSDPTFLRLISIKTCHTLEGFTQRDLALPSLQLQAQVPSFTTLRGNYD